MAVGPFGPWRLNHANARPGPLADADLLEDASILHELFRVSNGRLCPDDIDRLEIWQIAVLLGHAKELSDERPASTGQGQAVTNLHAISRDRNRARVAAARGEGPKPEPAPVDPATFNQLAGALSGRS